MFFLSKRFLVYLSLSVLFRFILSSYFLRHKHLQVRRTAALCPLSEVGVRAPAMVASLTYMVKVLHERSLVYIYFICSTGAKFTISPSPSLRRTLQTNLGYYNNYPFRPTRKLRPILYATSRHGTPCLMIFPNDGPF